MRLSYGLGLLSVRCNLICHSYLWSPYYFKKSTHPILISHESHFSKPPEVNPSQQNIPQHGADVGPSVTEPGAAFPKQLECPAVHV